MSFEDTYKLRKSHLYSSISKGAETASSHDYSSYDSSKSAYSPPSTGRQSTFAKPSASSTYPKPPGTPKPPVEVKNSSGGNPSSFLANIAGSAGATSSSSGVRSSGGFYSFNGSNTGIRSNIESRLKWMETAFKTDQSKGGEAFNAKATLGSARRRIMTMLREQMTPQLRSELQKLDKELADLGDHI